MNDTAPVREAVHAAIDLLDRLARRYVLQNTCGVSLPSSHLAWFDTSSKADPLLDECVDYLHARELLVRHPAFPVCVYFPEAR